jgi:hypothetical protein
MSGAFWARAAIACAALAVGGAGLVASARKPKPAARQFTLIDATFTFTKDDADNSTPSKSHYYVTGKAVNPKRPLDWTAPVNFRDGTVHIRTEVLERPESGEGTQWSLCYIPNRGQGNGYGCTDTGVYTQKGVYEKDVSMRAFWENEGLVWSEGVKQIDIVMKNAKGEKVHTLPDPEKYVPTKVRITMVQVAAGATYDPKLVQNIPHGKR